MRLPLTLWLHGSRQLPAALFVAHLLAACAIIPLALPWTVRLLLLGLIVFSWVVLLRRQQPVAALILGTYGALEVQLPTKVGAGETAIAATIEPHTTLFPGLIVLLLRVGGKRIVLPLFPDALGTDQHRQLRLWLQWRAKTGVNASV